MRMTTRCRAAGITMAATLLLGACSGATTTGSGAGGTPSGSGPGGTGPDGTAAGAPAPDLPACPVDALAAANGPVEIVLWHSLSAKPAEAINAAAERYNASQTKVHLRVEKQGVAYAELLRKYESAMQSRSLPDLVITEDTATRFMIDSDTVLPAESCLRATGRSKGDYVPTAVDHFSLDGVLYPASANLSDILTYYNKNHFRRAGLDPDKPPTTLAEVRADAEKIKAAGVADKPLVLKLDSWFIETQLTGDRQPIVDNDNGRGPGATSAATFDTARTVELFTWIKQMHRDGLLEAVPFAEGNIDHVLAMGAQKSSMSVESSAAATSVQAFLRGDTTVAGGADTGAIDVNGLDIGAGRVFGVAGPGRAQIGGGAWYLTRTGPAEKQAASWDFMTWWNGTDQQVDWHLKSGYLPFVTKAADDPKVKAFWADTPDGRWVAVAYQELKEGVNPDFTGPLIGAYDKFRPAIRNGLDAMIFKDADPQAAVTQAAQETTAAVQEYRDGGFG